MKRQGQKGQVLVEILIGIAVLAVVTAALMQAFQSGILGTNRVDERITALNLAQFQMEYIRAQPYEEYDAQGEPVEEEGYSEISEEDLPAGFTSDDIEIAVSNLGNETSPDEIQLVTVTVTFGINDDIVTIADYNRNE
jgi:type II secretory pathway pseudopilin PulG